MIFQKDPNLGRFKDLCLGLLDLKDMDFLGIFFVDIALIALRKIDLKKLIKEHASLRSDSPLGFLKRFSSITFKIFFLRILRKDSTQGLLNDSTPGL